MCVSRPVSLLAVGILLLVTSAGVAGADTRLFSVETDRPGVTVTGVERDGQALPQEGESGARTFFRIDGGSGDVPCRNQLLFTASDGQKREFIVDLCAHDWQVKLPLGEAASDTSPSQPSSRSEAPTGGITRLTVHIDVPDISITEVYLDRARLELDRDANGVSAALTAEQGGTCEHDLGLALSDGRRIARVVDICAYDGAVGVAVNSDSAAPPPPPVTTPPPAAAVSSEPARIEDLVWSSGSEGGRATLAYAWPNSDQVEFFASCNPGTADIEISLERSESGLEPGGSVPVTFSIGGFERTYNARGSDVSALSGVSHPEMRLDVADPFWPALLRGNDLTVRIGSAAAYTLSLRGSSAAGRPFLAACDRQAAPEAGPQSASASASDYSCGEEGRLRSQRTDIESRLIFHNRSGVPVRLFWLDYDGRRRPYMTLGPGETGVQPSFYSHPWLVTDLRGRCLGIYSARRSDTEITLAP